VILYGKRDHEASTNIQVRNILRELGYVKTR